MKTKLGVLSLIAPFIFIGNLVQVYWKVFMKRCWPASCKSEVLRFIARFWSQLNMIKKNMTKDFERI